MASGALVGLTSNSQTTLTVSDGGFSQYGGTVLIEAEQITYVEATDKQLLGCVRGANSTSAVQHANGKAVIELVHNEAPGSTFVTSQVITNTIADTDALTINNTTPSRGLLVNGKIIGQRNNGSALAVKGLQSPTEGTAVVNSYSGIFTDPTYSDHGTLDTRFVTGGNLEMDVELQSPHMLRLSGGDNTTSDGSVRVSSDTNITLLTRGGNEATPDKYLIIDRLDTTIHADPPSNNSSDVTIKVNKGNLHINNGVTTGALVLPILTAAQRDAISPAVEGSLIYNTDSNKLNIYDGAWKEVTSA